MTEPVFSPQRCALESVLPISRQSWFQATEVPQAPGDILDCAQPLTLPSAAIPCPNIEIGTISGSTHPVLPRDRAVWFEVRALQCCGFQPAFQLDLPCPELTPPSSTLGTAHTVSPEQARFQLGFLAQPDCVKDLDIVVDFPCPTMAPQIGFAETKKVNWGHEQLLFSFRKDAVCDWVLEQAIDFPCTYLHGEVELSAAECTPFPSTRIDFIKHNECDWQLVGPIRIETGCKLPDGQIGPQGDPGEPGVIGPTGPQGLIGGTGLQGPAGYTGGEGPQGPRGPVGANGSNGLSGEQGDRGSTGNQGLQGDRGPQGPEPRGPRGPQGYFGDDGAPCPQYPLPAKGRDGDPGKYFKVGDCYAEKAAILPLSGNLHGLFCVEMPEVYFEELLLCKLSIGQRKLAQAIDPCFVEICVPGSLRVVELCCSQPTTVGAWIADNKVCLDRSTSESDLRVHCKVAGLRRDVLLARFPEYTAVEMANNNHFWNQAKE